MPGALHKPMGQPELCCQLFLRPHLEKTAVRAPGAADAPTRSERTVAVSAMLLGAAVRIRPGGSFCFILIGVELIYSVELFSGV